MKVNWAVVFVVVLFLILIFVIASLYLSNKSECESQGQESIYDWRNGKCFKNAQEECIFYKHMVGGVPKTSSKVDC